MLTVCVSRLKFEKLDLQYFQSFEFGLRMSEQDLHTWTQHNWPPDLPRETYPPPYECSICCLQFRISKVQEVDGQAYVRKLTDLEAIDLAATSSDSIQKSFVYLRSMMSNHATTLAGRWRTKSREKREALLLEANPSGCEIEAKLWQEAEFVSGRGRAGIRSWRQARWQRNAVSKYLFSLIQ